MKLPLYTLFHLCLFLVLGTSQTCARGSRRGWLSRAGTRSGCLGQGLAPLTCLTCQHMMLLLAVTAPLAKTGWPWGRLPDAGPPVGSWEWMVEGLCERGTSLWHSLGQLSFSSSPRGPVCCWGLLPGGGYLSGRGLARWLLVWIPLDNPQETHIKEPHLARGECRLLHTGLPSFPPAAPAPMCRAHAGLHPEGGSLSLRHLAPPGAALFTALSEGLRLRGVEIDIGAHFMELNHHSNNPGRYFTSPCFNLPICKLG